MRLGSFIILHLLHCVLDNVDILLRRAETEALFFLIFKEIWYLTRLLDTMDILYGIVEI